MSRGRRDAGSVAGLYDRWASHQWVYEAMTRVAFFGRRERLRRRAVASLGLSPGARVLDLACGNGVDFEPLADAVGTDGEIVAIDVSPASLELARDRAQRLACRVELRRADLAAAELEPAGFDGAVISLALSALPDRQPALERIAAALRPGAGLAVLDTLPFQPPFAWLNRLIGPPFRAFTNWDYEADLVGDLERAFTTVESSRLNGGSALLALASSD